MREAWPVWSCLSTEAGLMCDVWGLSRSVLGARFPASNSMRASRASPSTLKEWKCRGGFLCTYLSQASPTAGIGGEESGLVAHVFRLLALKFLNQPTRPLRKIV